MTTYDPTDALHELNGHWSDRHYAETVGLGWGYTRAQQERIAGLTEEAAAAGVVLAFDDETGRWLAN